MAETHAHANMHKGLTIKCLDHGYITVRNWMGDLSDIVNAARISYGQGTKSHSDDVALMRYLIRHAHNTPMEMAELCVEFTMPIFVMRQWIRHRMSSTNEVSARYSVLPDTFYIPKPEHLGLQSQTNKQGRSLEAIDPEITSKVLDTIKTHSKMSYENYEELLSYGISRELARMVLPVNIYTKAVWKIDCNNLLKMLKLREDTHAQYEIRVYAIALSEVLKIWMPDVHQAYVDYVRDAQTLSVQQMQILQTAFATYSPANLRTVAEHIKFVGKTEGMSNREFDDLVKMFS